MSVFSELIAANAKETYRDKMATFWYIAFPILFMVLFGAIFSGGTDDRTFNVGLVAESKGPVSEGIEKSLGSVPLFKLYVGDRQSELEALKKGDRSIFIVVPKDAGTSVLRGKPVSLPIYYDATQQTAGQVVLPAISQVIGEIDRGMTGRPKLLVPKPTPVQSEKLKDIDFLVPGIIAMTIMQLGLFGSLRIVSFRERKVLKSLGATPLPRFMFLLSEIMVRLVLSLVQAAIIMAIGHFMFGVSIVGNWFSVFGVVLLGALAFISMGYMLVCIAKTVESGQGIVQAVQFPMMFLSGIFFPVTMIPKFLLPVVKAMPLTYLGDALRQVMLGASAAQSVTINLLILIAWLVVTLLIATKMWKWE